MASNPGIEEYRRLIRLGELVIVHYYDGGDRSTESRELYYAFKDLTKSLTGKLGVTALQIDVSQGEYAGLGITTPLIRVYHKGRILFEQKGGFGNSQLDYYVLRRSIRETLRRSHVDIKI